MNTRIVTTILTDAFAHLSAGDSRAITGWYARLLRRMPDTHFTLRRVQGATPPGTRSPPSNGRTPPPPPTVSATAVRA